MKPPRILRGSVPIIGAKKFNDQIVVEFGELKLHPPVNPQSGKVEAGWIMTMAQIVGLAAPGRTVLAVFNFEMMAFLAEDHETVGQQGDMVIIRPCKDGTVNVTKAVPPAPPSSGIQA